MAITIMHNIDLRNELIADVRRPEYAAWDVHVRHAENNSGTLSLAIREDNPELPMVNALRSELVILDDGVEIWRGRVTKLERTDAGRSTLTAMGLLDYLHDTIAPALTASTGTAKVQISKLLTQHNSKSISSRQKFYVGSVTISDTVELTTNGRRETWQELSSLVSKYGGQIFSRREANKNYLDWVASVDQVCSRTLESGASISSLTLAVDPNELATVLYAYGGNVDGAPVDLTSVNSGKAYLTDEEAIATFGWIEGCYQESSIKTAAELKTAAQKELKRRINAVRSVRVTAIDRADAISSEQLGIGSKIRVRAQRLDIDELMPIKELDWYPYEPKKTTLICCASLKAISRII